MKQTISLVVAISIFFYGMPFAAAAKPQRNPTRFYDLLELSYVELFERPPQLNLSSESIKRFEQQLERPEGCSTDPIRLRIKW